MDTFYELDKLKYLDAVIKEGLRMFPPQTTFIGRSPHEDFIYTKDDRTYILPKGIHIQIGLIQLHYDETLWTNPHQFNPDRFLDDDTNNDRHKMAWQAFGFGPRRCIGQRFAYMVLKLTLAKLVHDFKLTPTEKTEEVIEILYKVATMTPKNGSWAMPKQLN